jgi:dihydrolipoamide dehydrogenase
VAGTYARSTKALVIGGGPGGYVAAIRLGQLGVPTILVERADLGGECLNRGCIPSKALIHAATLYDSLRQEGPEVGVIAEGLHFDLAVAQKWKDGVVAHERQGVASLLRAAGVTVLRGEARFTSPRSVELIAPDGGRERIDFEQAIIAVGAFHTALPGFEPDGGRVVNAWQILSLQRLPESMLVLGGGVSGCELGEFMARVGVKVTIVELLAQLLPGVEPDLSRELTGALERMGVTVRVGSRATAMTRGADGVRMHVTGPAGEEDLVGDILFVTVGKRADTETLGLKEAGVRRDAKTGFIPVDEQQRTNQPTIFAVSTVCELCGRPAVTNNPRNRCEAHKV